jgi:alpha-amylase
MNPVTLTIVVHNHQPRGNFEHVFRKACDQCYERFLALLEQNPWFACGLHYSGCLLDWMDQNRPDLIERLKALVERGQVELLGGGYYEPIFTMLAERDRRGQIESFTRYLRQRFGHTVTGAWLPERVWEQDLASTLADSGIRYTVLDDFHFKRAGLRAGQIRGYYITEDQGRLLRVFASDENLRYWIPFKEPERTIGYLQAIGQDSANAVICYGDDGEKFGLWPETFRHCHENGWLSNFFAALRANADWLTLRKPGEVIDALPATGKVYLPDCSYREMTEWALPADVLAEYEDLYNQVKETEWGQRIRPFLAGGTWRNFRAKYVAAARMHGRMMEASELADRVPGRLKAKREALRSLYQGQCNCAYWHGVFGGLYLPHLRRAVYADLLRSSAVSESALGGLPPAEQKDFDLDGLPEVKLNTPSLAAYFKPDRGGRCYELDLKEAGLNVLATLHRQKEAYHRTIVQFAGRQTGGVETIHELVRFKQEGLEKRLIYDPGPRDSAVEHVLSSEGGAEDAAGLRLTETGGFPDGAYEVLACADDEGPSVLMRRDGRIAGPEGPVLRVQKRASLREEPAALAVEYELSAVGKKGLHGLRFAVEFNVAMSAADAEGRHVWLVPGEPAGSLGSVLAFESRRSVGLTDEWLGLEVAFEFSPAADVWVFPIQTVSQSESGFELTYQGSCVCIVWPLALRRGTVQRRSVVQTMRLRSRA